MKIGINLQSLTYYVHVKEGNLFGEKSLVLYSVIHIVSDLSYFFAKKQPV